MESNLSEIWSFINTAILAIACFLAKQFFNDIKEQFADTRKQLDKLGDRIERLTEGRANFIPRGECRESVARLHQQIDILEAADAELRNRIGLIEGKLAPDALAGKGL